MTSLLAKKWSEYQVEFTEEFKDQFPSVVEYFSLFPAATSREYLGVLKDQAALINELLEQDAAEEDFAVGSATAALEALAVKEPEGNPFYDEIIPKMAAKKDKKKKDKSKK
jgi:hypothetical protein